MSDALPTTQKDAAIKERVRARALELLEHQIEYAVSITRAEGSASDNIRLISELRSTAGVDEKSKYDNIPNITVMIGADFSQTVTVEPVKAPLAEVVDVTDVEPVAPGNDATLPAPEAARIEELLDMSSLVTLLED